MMQEIFAYVILFIIIASIVYLDYPSGKIKV